LIQVAPARSLPPRRVCFCFFIVQIAGAGREDETIGGMDASFPQSYPQRLWNKRRSGQPSAFEAVRFIHFFKSLLRFDKFLTENAAGTKKVPGVARDL
jgi:hypothetical protein